MEEAKSKDAVTATTVAAAGPSTTASVTASGAIVGTIMSNIHARVNRLSEPELNQEHLQQVNFRNVAVWKNATNILIKKMVGTLVQCI